MNNNHTRLSWGIILLLFFAVSGISQTKDESDYIIHQKAKKYCIDQKWEKALDLFQQLIDDYPDSQYLDDAHFWIGYCLEKKEGSEIEAFLAFETLKDEFNNSTWVDDAIVHQISLAEKLVKMGREPFISFLSEKSRSEDEKIRQQAALSLGRLNDKRALPVLAEIKDHEDLGPLAQSLIEKLQSQKTEDLQVLAGTDEQSDIRIDVNAEMGKDRVTKIEKVKTPFFYYTKRHKQYRDMLKDRETWTKENLIDFAMWHILPTHRYEEFSALKGYDRSEWLRKYWKMRDPTPTTERNEAEEEFERRVNYARAHFAESWIYQHVHYLKDQFIREGRRHAPWDARGEIYIKYGDPDHKTIITDFKEDYFTRDDYFDEWLYKEEWIYNKYNVDFIINKYMTNIYGKAIFPGEMSRYIYRNNSLYVDANFINYPEFLYEHDYDAKQLKKLKLTINSDTTSQQNNIIVDYRAPIKEFRLNKYQNQYTLKYLQRIVVFDEDFNEVFRDETTNEMTEKNKKTFKRLKEINMVIPLELDPGEYTVALRIEDQQSKKIGICIEQFNVEE